MSGNISYEAWYFQNKDRYELLCKRVRELLIRALKEQGIGFVQVQARVKEIQSFKDKMTRVGHSKPQDILDIVGIRLICYLLSDYKTFYEVIKQNFILITHEPVIKDNGYKAEHFIVTLKQERTKLIEYRQFGNIKFEIQICTILEHAWNEIEHDRGYKGDLPCELQSKFQLLAKDLHTIDKEFQGIATKSQDYESKL